MNVMMNEQLLEKARQAAGEKTYSATITKALEEFVRRHDFTSALRAFQAEVSKGNFFWPGYLDEIRPNNSFAKARKRKISANEVRAPRSRSGSRGSR